jgi:hypothetical protein
MGRNDPDMKRKNAIRIRIFICCGFHPSSGSRRSFSGLLSFDATRRGLAASFAERSVMTAVDRLALLLYLFKKRPGRGRWDAPGSVSIAELSVTLAAKRVQRFV